MFLGSRRTQGSNGPFLLRKVVGTLRAALRGLHSPDISDLRTYRPERPDEFGFLLQVFAGPEGQEGEESFGVVVCTPKWLLQKPAVRHRVRASSFDCLRVRLRSVAPDNRAGLRVNGGRYVAGGCRSTVTPWRVGVRRLQGVEKYAVFGELCGTCVYSRSSVIGR